MEIEQALGVNFGLQPLPESPNGAAVSVPERALPELRSDAEVGQGLEEARNIMEGVRSPRIGVLGTLLKHPLNQTALKGETMPNVFITHGHFLAQQGKIKPEALFPLIVIRRSAPRPSLVPAAVVSLRPRVQPRPRSDEGVDE